MPGVEGNAKRETSGLGGSILITSAPRSSRVRAQRGPASTREKSTTRMPPRGPLMSASREFGETEAIFPERGQPNLQVIRCPDRLLDLGHRLVCCEYPLIDGDVYKPLRRSVRNRRSVRQFLGDCKRGILQRVVCNHEIDETPALERRGVIAPPEHRDLLGAHRTGALHLPLDAAKQRMQSECNLDRTDLCRTRRDDVVA